MHKVKCFYLIGAFLYCSNHPPFMGAAYLKAEPDLQTSLLLMSLLAARFHSGFSKAWTLGLK